MVGVRRAVPVSMPLTAGITVTSALAAPVEDRKNPLNGVLTLRRSLPGGPFLKLDSEVSRRDINGRSAQSHFSESALDSRNRLLPLPWLHLWRIERIL